MALLRAEMSELLVTVARIVAVVFTLFLSTLMLRKWKLKSGRSQHEFPLPPGPRPLPLVGNLPALGSRPHQSLAKLAKTYGPLMYLRLGSVPTVIVSSAEMAEEILKTHDKVFASRPHVMSCEIMGYGSQNFGFLPYGDEWRNARKLFTTQLVTAKRIQDTQVRPFFGLDLVCCSSGRTWHPVQLVDCGQQTLRILVLGLLSHIKGYLSYWEDVPKSIWRDFGKIAEAI